MTANFTFAKNIIFWATLGQLSLFTGVFVSWLLVPKFFVNGGGISNYGVQPETSILYSFGFAIAAVSSFRCAQLMQVEKLPRARILSNALFGLAVLYFLVLLSTYTYKINDTFGLLHIAVSIALVVSMVAIGVYLTCNMPDNKINRVLRYGLLAGAVVTCLTVFGVMRTLFIGEVVTGIIFGVILVRTMMSIRVPTVATLPASSA